MSNLRNQVVEGIAGSRGKRGVAKKEVDDANETLHNLASLLLTNKTICRNAASSTE